LTCFMQTSSPSGVPCTNFNESSIIGSLTIDVPGVDPSDLTIEPTPLPAAFPLLATALAALGLFGWRRQRAVARVAQHD
jgi:hypothetical protein